MIIIIKIIIIIIIIKVKKKRAKMEKKNLQLLRDQTDDNGGNQRADFSAWENREIAAAEESARDDDSIVKVAPPSNAVAVRQHQQQQQQQRQRQNHQEKIQKNQKNQENQKNEEKTDWREKKREEMRWSSGSEAAERDKAGRGKRGSERETAIAAVGRGFGSFFFTIPGHTDGHRRRGRKDRRSFFPAQKSVSRRHDGSEATSARTQRSQKQQNYKNYQNYQNHHQEPVNDANRNAKWLTGLVDDADDNNDGEAVPAVKKHRLISSSHSTLNGGAEAWGLLCSRHTTDKPRQRQGQRQKNNNNNNNNNSNNRSDNSQSALSAAALAMRQDPSEEKTCRKSPPCEANGSEKMPNAPIAAAAVSPPLSRCRSSSRSSSEMGPMDCADAFLYFLPDEGTFTQQESSIYRAPETATLSLETLQRRYQTGLGSSGGRSNNGGNCSGNCSGGGTSRSGENDHTRSGFVSLAEDLQRYCTSHTQPAVVWRRVERSDASANAPATLRNRGNGKTSSTSSEAVGTGGDVKPVNQPQQQTSRGEMVSSPRAAATAAPLFFFPSDKSSAAVAAAVAAAAPPTYYLGPQQHLTGPLLWTKIVAFGWGLRSLGLHPGSCVGLCADTRWEWLATVHACWSQGFVPVVFHNGERCLAAMAAECTEMKVVVCGQSLVPAVRRQVRAALAAAKEVEEQLAAGPGCSNTSRGQTPRRGTPQQRRCNRAMPLCIAMHDLVSGDSQLEDVEIAAPHRGHAGAAGVADEEEEEEEALWWTDVLAHGESKLYEYRSQQLRAWKSAHRRQAYQLQQQQQQQHQHQRQQRELAPESSLHPPSVPAGVTDSSTSIGDATTQLTGSGGCNSNISDSARGLLPPSPNRLQQQQMRGSHAVAANSAPLARTIGGTRVAAYGVPPRQETGTAALPPRLPSPMPFYGARNQESVAPFAIDTSTFAFTSESMLTPLRATDLAMILYSEGDPKGVMLTHGGLKASVTAYAEKLRTFGLLGESAEASGDSGVAVTGAATTTTTTTTTKTAWERRDVGELAAFRNSDSAATDGHGLVSSLTERAVSRPSEHRRTYVAYLPQHHLLEFLLETVLMLDGYLICYGSRATLFDGAAKPHGDLAEYRPQLMAAPPEVYAHVCRKLEDTLPAGGYRRLIFDVGYEERRLALQRGLDTPYLNTTVFSQTRQLLGGRCRLALSYGGPLHPRTQEYLQVISGATVVQVFAPVEAGGCGLMGASWAGEQLLDCLGGPLGAVEVKLRDTADPKAVGPNSSAFSNRDGGEVPVRRRRVWSHRGVRPCGELLLRGPAVTCGFYRQVERAAEVLEEGGWVHTGEIVERLPNGGFRLLASLDASATTNATGHRFALEALERAYGSHPLCAGSGGGNLCVLAHPYRSYLCALLITNEARAGAFLSHPQTQQFLRAFCSTASTHSSAHQQRTGRTIFSHNLYWRGAPSGEADESALQQQQQQQQQLQWPDGVQTEAFSAAAVASLNFWGRTTAALRSHEQLREVRVLNDVWNFGNGLRSPTGKIHRAAVEARYAALIAELFAEEV